MDDLISRAQALALAKEAYIPVDGGAYMTSYIDADDIRNLPSAEKHGRWVIDTKGVLHCSNCIEIPTNRFIFRGDLVYDMTPIKTKMKFCPNCGADMRERKEE